MDFNTRPGGAGGDSRPPGGTGTVPGGPGDDYNLSDPVGSFVSTARRVLLEPVGFFRSIPRQGNLPSPIVFAMICAFVGAFLAGIISIVAAALGIGQTGVGGAIGAFFASIILTPILTPVGLFIGGAITHLFVLLFVRPQNAGFWATFRVVSYVSATSLISWIPVIGGIVAAVWGIVLSIFGIREMHSTTTGRAALVVLVPVAIIIILGVLLAGALIAALFFGSQQ